MSGALGRPAGRPVLRPALAVGFGCSLLFALSTLVGGPGPDTVFDALQGVGLVVAWLVGPGPAWSAGTPGQEAACWAIVVAVNGALYAAVVAGGMALVRAWHGDSAPAPER